MAVSHAILISFFIMIIMIYIKHKIHIYIFLYICVFHFFTSDRFKHYKNTFIYLYYTKSGTFYKKSVLKEFLEHTDSLS